MGGRRYTGWGRREMGSCGGARVGGQQTCIGSAPALRRMPAHFAQEQFSHLHVGPQLHALGAGSQLQVGAHLQGLHLQLSVIGELLCSGWWSG